MKLQPNALASTLAIIAFTTFVLCMLWLAIDTTSFVFFWESWSHGFDLRTDTLGTLNAQSIFGLLSFTATGWVVGYTMALIYNRLNKEVL